VLPKRSQSLKLGKPPSRSTQLVTPKPPNPFCQSLRSGSLLGLSLHSYRIQKVVICWLFFSLTFVSLPL
jgi:hypothetical protein